jgi:predicted SprT family Zn-dependent metalloprotease
LQAPTLSIALTDGTNLVLALAFGQSLTNNPGVVFARRNNEPTIVTVSTNLLEPWYASYDKVRDEHLVSPTGALAEIEIHGAENFTLVRSNYTWLVTTQNFSADAFLVGELIKRLGALKVKFDRDAVPPPELPTYGLVTPRYQIILRETVTNALGALTNVTVQQINFGTNKNDEFVFAQRLDEPGVVYSVKSDDFRQLPQTALELRERRIWKFTESDVARITVQQNGKTRLFMHQGSNDWKFASEGIAQMNSFALEEVAHRFGELSADYWTQKGDQNRETFGFNSENHRITLDLKNGEKRTVEFGKEASLGSPYAMVTLEGQPWIFTFSPVLYAYVQLYLTVPPDAP